MGSPVKATKERCLKCQYCMNLTGTSFVKKGMSGALVACGYILKTGESRVFKDGKKRKGHKQGYCNRFKEGKRIDSIDNLSRHSTVIKRRERNNDD